MDDYKYDEDKAVKSIRGWLGHMWDYYERNGYLSLDASVTDEEDTDVAALTAYVKKEIAKDKEILMDPADVDLIVKGELAYEQTLEDFI